MDFNRMWTDFALAAEYERFGMTRIAAAHNSAIKQREQDMKDAARYRWLAQYPNLFTVNDLLRADQYTTLTRACDALMSVAATAKEFGGVNQGLLIGTSPDGRSYAMRGTPESVAVVSAMLEHAGTSQQLTMESGND